MKTNKKKFGMSGLQLQEQKHLIPGYIALTLWCVFIFSMLGWIVMAALSTTREIFSDALLESGMHWENFTKVIKQGHLMTAFMNSLLYSSSSVFLSVLVSAPCAYGLARFKFALNSSINHGANDRFSATESYCDGYLKLLDVITDTHPDSKIIVLAPFCGAHEDALEMLVSNYNARKKTDITFIRTTNWIPKEPLHPDREGHREVSRRLVSALQHLGL